MGEAMIRANAVFLFLALLTPLSVSAEEGGPAPSNPAPLSLRAAIQAQSSWETLQAVPEGTRCRVTLKDGKTSKGLLQQWTPERLVLSDSKGKLSECMRTDVVLVETLSPGSRRNRVLWTGLCVFGAMAAAGYAAAPYIADDDTMGAGERAGAGLMLGGIFGGAAAGLAAIPKAERAMLVYRAP
jgi:hypothetical protein